MGPVEGCLFPGAPVPLLPAPCPCPCPLLAPTAAPLEAKGRPSHGAAPPLPADLSRGTGGLHWPISARTPPPPRLWELCPSPSNPPAVNATPPSVACWPIPSPPRPRPAAPSLADEPGGWRKEAHSFDSSFTSLISARMSCFSCAHFGRSEVSASKRRNLSMDFVPRS